MMAFAIVRGPCYDPHITGRSSAWLERLVWVQEVASSNLVAPILSAVSRNGSPSRQQVEQIKIIRRRAGIQQVRGVVKDVAENLAVAGVCAHSQIQAAARSLKPKCRRAGQ